MLINCKRLVRSHVSPASAAMLLPVLSCFAMPCQAGAAAGDSANGMKLYEAKCGGCHSLDMNRVGPAHRGVVGRPIASAPGYTYSNAIKKLGGTWTPRRLDQWLQGPQNMAPGTKMFFSVPSASDRADIITYLAANSDPSK